MATSEFIKRGTNGLATFTGHASDSELRNSFSALRNAPSFDSASTLPGQQTMKSLSAEDAALRQVTQAFDNPHLPGLVAPKAGIGSQELKSLGTERVGLTGTTVVKFRQFFNKIPVYGSLVTVELDDDNEIMSLNSAVGAPNDVASLAKVSPAAAMEIAVAATGRQPLRDVVPRLNYYFDDEGKWRLVYILEDMPAAAKDRPSAFCDVVVDANSGDLVALLPRTPTLTVPANDGRGALQIISVSELDHTVLALRDLELNVHTYDFGFQDPDVLAGQLPGDYVQQQTGAGWDPMAVSAHANATAVVTFLPDVLQRQNIDNKGGALHSSINCVVQAESPGGNVWENAYWNSMQMVYGQKKVGGKLVSMAVSLDIVAHEMFHGVTERTARLEYAKQAGALNESLSDIFGVIVSNYSLPDYAAWNWEIGDGLGGAPFRDMRSPARFQQPEHMKDFVVMPNTSSGDWGGVHTNSGIPNRMAYLMMTSKHTDGSYVFSAAESASVFYIALSQYLSRTSNFSQSRTAVDSAVKTLFRNDSTLNLRKRVGAVAAAFTAVGIV